MAIEKHQRSAETPPAQTPFRSWVGIHILSVTVKNRDECVKPHEDFEPLIDRVAMHLQDDIKHPELRVAMQYRVSLLRRIVKSHLWDLCICESISEVKANGESGESEQEESDEDWKTDEGDDDEEETTLAAEKSHEDKDDEKAEDYENEDLGPLEKLMEDLEFINPEVDGVETWQIKDPEHKAALRKQLENYISEYLAGRAKDSDHRHEPVFSSEWLKHLHDHGILLKPKDELDWSGRGQHVEYDASDEGDIPLQVKKVLGYSATAIVESVQCRRILLARKTVRCNRRLTKETVVMELQHLQRLQHSHIVRVVGTYTIRKSLCILLYPAADQNLEELMDTLVELPAKNPGHGFYVLPKFLGCLSNAVSFIHHNNVKHMDIKTKNILIRQEKDQYKVYLADFGIAKSYESAAHAFTDSPTSFTRTYAAPEVVLQDVRGYPADIFSLGCVFMEIFATMRSTQALDEREHLNRIRGHDFQSNIESIVAWYESCTNVLKLDQTWNNINDEIQHLIARTLSRSAEDRPTADDLKRATAHLRCEDCDTGSEPFVATIT